MAQGTPENLGRVRNPRLGTGSGRAGIPKWFGIQWAHRLAESLKRWGIVRDDTQACHLIAFAVTSAVLFYPAFQLFDRTPPFEFVGGKISPARADGKIYPGSPITVQWTMKEIRQEECGGLIRRTLVDSKGAITEMAPVAALYSMLREGQSFQRTVSLPDGFSAGPGAYYQVRSSYWCNWLQKALLPVFAESPRLYFNVDQFPNQILRP